ncbi:ESX secretion-associated protein EspG [Amycolatopsis sp. CA-128772]|uniref:ESX secretion-associated protein EspG n=1 Tax=Amycolatopsis sp. CA-128772 TaxID=2073159 RepID=UPI000CD2FEA8|nr:ESX secretion-associated protein EspG [Amycolatopsis sp. CA-128772]
MPVRHEAVLNARSVHWAAERLGLVLPAVLAPEPVWRSAEAEAERAEAAREELAAEGLLDRDEPGEDLEDSLRLLCRAPAEVSAYVQTEELTYRLHAAAGKRSGAFACYLPRESRLLLSPARLEALATIVARELPEHPPARSVSYSVPVTDLTTGEPHGQAARVAAIFAQARYAGGQLSVGVRDHRGHRRGEPVTFVDTEQGRWLSHLSADGRFVTTVGGSDGVLVAKLEEQQRELG